MRSRRTPRRKSDLKQIEDCRGFAKNTTTDGRVPDQVAGTGRHQCPPAVWPLRQSLTGPKVRPPKVWKMSSQASGRAASSLSTASTTMIVGLSVAVIIGICLAIFITRSITKPIHADHCRPHRGRRSRCPRPPRRSPPPASLWPKAPPNRPPDWKRPAVRWKKCPP